MPASQLKRLKASLRDQGIVGPQQSKKQRKKNAQNERGGNEKRLARSAALEGIREQFNPFQFKTNARGPKFEVTTDKPEKKKGILGRPGVAKALGEERRKETLLVEMQRRNRVGGIFDRRFGEGDPSMTPETAAAQRFAMEKQKAHKKSSMFDLEDDDEGGQGISLTHGGKSLTFGEDGELKDDFDEEFSDDGSDMSDLEEHNRKRLKRLRDQVASNEEGDQEEPERKKSKKEIMEEVIAKSKMHKYERQAAKEEDEDLRMELDKETADIRRLLLGKNWNREQNGEKEDEAKKMAIPGVDKETFEKDYDLAVRKMVADKRAKPTMRTKTEEEIAEQQSTRLRELEEKRLRRMRGEEVSDSEPEEEGEDEPEPAKGNKKKPAVEILHGDGEDVDFGLGKGIKMRPTATELGFDDEDDFIIDDDLVASGSDLDDPEDDDEDSDAGSDEVEATGEDEDDDFIKGLLTESETKDAVFAEPVKGGPDGAQGEDGLPFTFPCPQSHPELLQVLENIPLARLPTVVQRIRALYHPKLLSENKEKLANFSQVLVQHIAYLGTISNDDDLYPSLELLIRHVHSLAKMFPIEVGKEFRAHIENMEQERPLSLNIGDLYILTAIGSIFPTSDHFHQVVTPAMLSIGRFLGQKIPDSLADYATGTYLCTLAVQYQKLAKRYVPEVMNFSLNTICALAPVQARSKLGDFPVHQPAPAMRTKDATEVTIRKLKTADCQNSGENVADAKSLKVALLSANLSLLIAAAETWTGKPAFYETFEPAIKVLKHLTSKANRAHLPPPLLQDTDRTSAQLSRALKVATLSRRPLELHNHRPLAIKTYIPKFEDDFDPDKHYDPDRERAELAKLKAEHKKERKGAMRELRKDANFMAREKLRLKKEKDAAYEKKYKRLVAEIQSEEGHQSNLYEKEKAARKKAKNR